MAGAGAGACGEFARHDEEGQERKVRWCYQRPRWKAAAGGVCGHAGMREARTGEMMVKEGRGRGEGWVNRSEERRTG